MHKSASEVDAAAPDEDPAFPVSSPLFTGHDSDRLLLSAGAEFLLHASSSSDAETAGRKNRTKSK